MKTQLELVAKSYDRGIGLGRKGLDSYQNFPEHITNDPDYPLFQKARAEGLDSDSGSAAVKEYLSPSSNMKFVDLGCCLNLVSYRYNEWPSLYYGVDISKETIALLDELVTKRNLAIGSLYCGSIHQTPFDDNSFDIGACIGVLEYYERDFAAKALLEAQRIMTPNGRFVLDIPDNENRRRRFMNLIEEQLGRPTKFDLSVQEFEHMLQDYFEVEKTENLAEVAMIKYFLRCRK
jgi:Methylase involved in ubiquinone/menaquinone biosynthesis